MSFLRYSIKPKTPGPAKPLRGNARRQLTSQKRRGRVLLIPLFTCAILSIYRFVLGGANTQKSLGVRIQNSQKNQRNKRQQVIAKRRPGLQSIRVSINCHINFHRYGSFVILLPSTNVRYRLLHFRIHGFVGYWHETIKRTNKKQAKQSINTKQWLTCTK